MKLSTQVFQYTTAVEQNQINELNFKQEEIIHFSSI